MEKDEQMDLTQEGTGAATDKGGDAEEELQEPAESSGETEYEPQKEDPSEERSSPGETKLVTDQGLTGDKYYVSEPWVDSQQLDEEDEEELSGIEIRYNLRPDEARAAMKAFQKKTLYKKNIIYTVVLAVLALLYLQAVIRNPDYAMGKVLGVFSLAVIGLLWYLPARHITQTVKGIELSKDTFTIEVSSVGFLIREESGKYLIRYQTPTVSVIELPEVFVVCVSNEKMFAVPKRCIPAEQMEEVKKLMKEGLGEKYRAASAK